MANGKKIPETFKKLWTFHKKLSTIEQIGVHIILKQDVAVHV